MIREVVLRPHKGWVRLWLLAALVWVAFASTTVVAPWQIGRNLQAIEIAGPTGQAAAETKLRSQAANLCQLGTASVESRIVPPSERELNDWRSERRVWELKRQLNLPAKLSPPPKPAVVAELTCVRAHEKTKAMARLLMMMFGPPIILPLLLALAEWIVLAIVGWVRDGFQGAVAPAIAGRATTVSVPPVATSAPPRAINLKQALGWCCAAFMTLDIVLRKALSQGQSSGTNLLVFAGLAAVVWLARARFGARAGRCALALYLIGGTAFLALSLAPYL